MQLLPLQIPSDFPDPALTLAVTPGSQGVGTALASLPVLSDRQGVDSAPCPTHHDHFTIMSLVAVQCAIFLQIVCQ